jgi:Cache 3/Cache 2 fusion domain
MNRRSFILTILATGFFIANATLAPDLGTAQADKVKTAMADLKARAEKIGAPKVEGKDLYFGTTKVDNSVVDAVAKEHGGAATIFVKAGPVYVRVGTTVKKEDGASAVGTPLDVKSSATARLNSGEAYYGDATVFGKSYDAGYEPIKDASGAVIGAYFVGQPK